MGANGWNCCTLGVERVIKIDVLNFNSMRRLTVHIPLNMFHNMFIAITIEIINFSISIAVGWINFYKNIELINSHKKLMWLLKFLVNFFFRLFEKSWNLLKSTNWIEFFFIRNHSWSWWSKHFSTIKYLYRWKKPYLCNNTIHLLLC